MNYLNVSLFSVAGVLLFLSLFTTILRCFVRIRILKAFGTDDYLMVAAASFYVLAEAFVFDAISLTHDKSLIEIAPVLSRAMKDMYFGEVFYTLTVWTLKLSVGAFLLRLVVKPVQRYVIYGTLLFVSLYSTAYVLMVIFQCTPIDHFWKPFNKGKCIPGKINTCTSYVHAATIGGSDLIFAILPIFVVWNLQMNTAMKVSVAGLLGLGALAGITTFIRMPYVKALEEATVLDFFDVTSRLAIWTCVEPGVGILVGSLAALRPLFRSYLGGSGIFSGGSDNHTTTDKRNGNSYWPSSRSNYNDGAYHMDSFAEANRKYVSSTVVESIKNKGWKGDGKDGWSGNESEEILTLHKGETRSAGKGTEGIHKKVEFKASSEASSHLSPTRMSTGEEAFATRGGFY